MPGIDKSHHLIASAASVFPMSLALPHMVLWVILAAASYGGAIEFIQPFFGRVRKALDSMHTQSAR